MVDAPGMTIRYFCYLRIWRTKKPCVVDFVAVNRIKKTVRAISNISGLLLQKWWMRWEKSPPKFFFCF
jgi:hypothetical protein